MYMPRTSSSDSAQVTAKFKSALSFHQQGELAQAEALYEEILTIQPKQADSLHMLGVIAFQKKEYRKAVDLFGKAIEIYPRHSAFYNNRGNALYELRQLDAALASFDQAIALKPDFADAYANQGMVLYDQGEFKTALASFDKALDLKYDIAKAYYYKGNILHHLNQSGDALSCFDQAIALKPDYAEAYANRGLVLKDRKELDAALTSFDSAIRLQPDLVAPRVNKAITLLLKGNFKEGFELFEYRWKNEKYPSPNRHFSQPLWLGKESLKGKTILLHSEQGLGDTIQFSRYAKSVADLGARVIMDVPLSLIGLIREIDGVSETGIPGSPLPHFDFHCPLPSLPLAFSTELETIPSPQHYLKSDPGKVAHWNLRLGNQTKPCIGLVWSGNTEPYQNRSIPLSSLLQCLPSGFHYVSLQKELREPDRETLLAHPEIVHFGDDLVDFSDTAALCELMDIIISIDTCVAHLAGALGKTVWIVLPFAPDWRWLLDRPDSPWYDSATLYRQDSTGDWEGVLQQLNADLITASTRLASSRPSNDLTDAQLDLTFRQALTLHQQGKVAQAMVLYEQILAVSPKHVDALHLSGVAALQSREHQRAADLIGRAIVLSPHNATFYSNRGIALKELGLLDAAVESYNRAIARKPEYSEAYSNRGLALHELKKFADALASFDKAITLKPYFPEALSNRGNTLQELNRFEEALDSYDWAIALKADYAEALSNRGLALQQLNRFDEALISFELAIALRADFADAWLNKAFALLLKGNFQSGWELYEWRWRYSRFSSPKRDFDRPLWLGKDSLAGKTILLHSEQGLGDTIQFARYTRLVAESGARVILELPQPLYRLLNHLEGVTQAVQQGDLLPRFDYHTPLLSLPLAFKTTLDTIPDAGGYIKNDPLKLNYWRERLGEKSAPRVGLVWSTAVKPDHNRNIALSLLIEQLPGGFQYVSLQKEIEESDRDALNSCTDIVHLGDELKDFSDTAALSELMDIVITIDTSVAHIAGALDKAVWILLPYTPNWRWLLDRADSPWYNSARLYRQQRFGDWKSLLENVTLDLVTEYGK